MDNELTDEQIIPEDFVNINRMVDLTRGKLVEMLRRERTTDEHSQDVS